MNGPVPSGFRTVLRRDLTEILRPRAMLLWVAIVVGASIALVAGAAGFLTSSEAWHDEGAASPVVRSIIGSVAIALAAIPPALAIPLFSSEPLVRDRSSGAFRAQLATPLRPRELVLGRACAVWLPTLVPSVLLPILALLVLDAVALTPVIGGTTIPGALVVVSIVAVPLLFFALATATIELGMLVSPDAAIAPSYVVGIAVLAGAPLASIALGVDLTGPAFGAGALVVAVVAVIAVLVGATRLSKERVALSSG